MELSGTHEPPPPEYGIVTEAMILRTYGPRLTLEELAGVLKISVAGIKKQMSKGVFPIPTYLRGKRYADYRDVAAYIDRCALDAREERDAERERLDRLADLNAVTRRRGGRKKKVEDIQEDK